MKYMGSKNRHAKEILSITLKDRKINQCYVEPFVGGANIIDKVPGNRIGNDVNPYLIALLKEMQKDDFSVPDVSEEFYNCVKRNKEKYPDWLVGYVGFQLSFGAMWFGTYRKDTIGKRNYSDEAKRNILKQSKNLNGVSFYCGNYWELSIPSQSIVYCDPPYQGTAKYSQNEISFDYNKFWNWCEQLKEKGHSIFVSEYNAPKNWKCVWEKEVVGNISINTGSKKSKEKLFTL